MFLLLQNDIVLFLKWGIAVPSWGIEILPWYCFPEWPNSCPLVKTSKNRISKIEVMTVCQSRQCWSTSNVWYLFTGSVIGSVYWISLLDLITVFAVAQVLRGAIDTVYCWQNFTNPGDSFAMEDQRTFTTKIGENSYHHDCWVDVSPSTATGSYGIL